MWRDEWNRSSDGPMMTKHVKHIADKASRDLRIAARQALHHTWHACNLPCLVRHLPSEFQIEP